jgi:hypothetical protein
VTEQESRFFIDSYYIEYCDVTNHTPTVLKFVTSNVPNELVENLKEFFLAAAKSFLGEVRYGKYSLPDRSSYGTVISVNPNFVTATIMPINHFDVYSGLKINIVGTYYKIDQGKCKVNFGIYVLNKEAEDIDVLLAHLNSATSMSLILQYDNAKKFMTLNNIAVSFRFL